MEYCKEIERLWLLQASRHSRLPEFEVLPHQLSRLLQSSHHTPLDLLDVLVTLDHLMDRLWDRTNRVCVYIRTYTQTQPTANTRDGRCVGREREKGKCSLASRVSSCPASPVDGGRWPAHGSSLTAHPSRTCPPLRWVAQSRSREGTQHWYTSMHRHTHHLWPRPPACPPKSRLS